MLVSLKINVMRVDFGIGSCNKKFLTFISCVASVIDWFTGLLTTDCFASARQTKAGKAGPTENVGLRPSSV